MAHWDGKIYQSDFALNYQATITDKLTRELAYWLSPEKVGNNPQWIAKTMTVIELMILFAHRNIYASTYIRDQHAVQRWREVFFSVWNGNWQVKSPIYFYADPEYRMENQPAIAARFDYLERIACYWGNQQSSESKSLKSAASLYPLPFYSIVRGTNPNNSESVRCERFIEELIEHLKRDIVYWLSSENRTRVWQFDLDEEAWVAADILSFICETFEQYPGADEQTVRHWRESTLQNWHESFARNNEYFEESDPLYQNIHSVFDRLEAVARIYQPA